MNIPFSKPTIGQEETDAVIRTMRSGWLAAGPETEAFEQEFSDYISPPGEHYYCIFTNSCTSALKMAYKIMVEEAYAGWVDDRWEAPRRIRYPANTFCATYSAGREITDQWFKMEPYTTEDEDGSGWRSVAVAYGGLKLGENGWLPQLYPKLETLAPLYLEDSAHRIEPNDLLVGKIRCYSFYATKNMTTGSGGMFVTNDKEIYEKARLYWRDGLSTSTHDRLNGKGHNYKVEVFSGGYDGNDIAAAIGREQLKKLPSFTARRNDIRDRFNAAFGKDWQGTHLYPFFVNTVEDVDDFIAHMKEGGVSCGYHYPGTGWKGVSLPIYPLLTNEEVDYIIKIVKSWKKYPLQISV